MKLLSILQLVALGGSVLWTACERSASASDTAAASAQHPHSESLDQLAVFRAKAGPPVSRFTDASPTRDALIRRFALALEAGDTTTLRNMALSRAEFAWLYYADSPQSKPPYELDAEMMWDQIQTRSARGLARALREYAGHLGYLRHECEPSPARAGAVTLYNACRVVHTYNGKPLAEPLFGSIIERDGQFKFVGFANRL